MLKESKKSRFDIYNVRNSVLIIIIPLPFGIVACTFFPTTSLEIAVYVVVNFSLFQVIFVLLLFLGMFMYANELESREKYKLPEIKNLLQHIY